MSRTVELGRAVLCSSSSQLQLWLKTLITLSPQQDATNLHHLDKNAFIEHLVEQNAWVCRGIGLHFTLQLSFQGKPLCRQEIGDLGRMILNAQVWGQLNLRPSLQSDDFDEEALTSGSGMLQLNISHSRTAPNLSGQQPHRVCSNVSFADVKPPSGVAIVALDSVQFVMEMVNVPSQRNSKNRKRSRRSSPSPSSSSSSKRHEVANEGGVTSTRINEVEKGPDLSASQLVATFTSPEQQNDKSPIGSPTRCEGRKRNADHALPTFGPDIPADVQEIGRLVDASFRLSISEKTPRSLPEIRILTSSFTGTLGEICPALWSPSYLPALSQRAHFLPIISQSLGRATVIRPRSMSLKIKIERLRSEILESGVGVKSEGAEDEDGVSTGCVSAKLWIQTQKSLFGKSVTAPLKSFCASSCRLPAILGSDELLDESPAFKEPMETSLCETEHMYVTKVNLDGSRSQRPSLTRDEDRTSIADPLPPDPDGMLLGLPATGGCYAKHLGYEASRSPSATAPHPEWTHLEDGGGESETPSASFSSERLARPSLSQHLDASRVTITIIPGLNDFTHT
ncbi:hypothetical protein BCR34DRAFT_372383 [Clohesyomyces aquaticus]|uniref:Uncharacterized protein n=1 Tax=Clohesyomyces aquaticus TaxID=1231657 RepID=A0A1Y1ZGF1_9PLEO|nr:hypothetical protein BCR34DRAFT_372383 [Clohesyomyces aquaticus]